MRKQIRCPDQASANALDSISKVQTAEGTLNEVQNMLQRTGGLKVKVRQAGVKADSTLPSAELELDIKAYVAPTPTPTPPPEV